MWKHWTHWIRSYFNYGWQTKKLYWTGCLPFKTSPGSGCFLSWLLSPWTSARVEERPLLWQPPQTAESDGSLPEGRSACKDLFRLPKGCPRSQKGRLHGVALRLQDSGNWYSFQTKGNHFLPTEETQGQPANPENAHSAFGILGRRGHQWQWRPGEWPPWQNQRSYRRVYGLLGKGCKRCPSRREMLLPL